MTTPMTEIEIEEARKLVADDDPDTGSLALTLSDFIAEVDRLRAELGHVEPAEEPTPAVALANERCECCGRVFLGGEQIASFPFDNLVACYGPCHEPPLVTRTIVSRRLSEPHEVEAMTRGVWAAHRDPAGPSRILVEPWIVTHIPTGLHVLVMPLRREEAIAIVERLGMMRSTGPRDLDILSVVSEVIRG